ncbi:unnamed protein product, partial [Mycena citricolor]
MSTPDTPTPICPCGLWKDRETSELREDLNLNDHPPAKRQRLNSASDDVGYCIIECTPEPSNHSYDEDEDTDSSNAVAKPETLTIWDRLKKSFATAIERYESDSVDETLSLLRGVLDECHR